MHLLLATRNAHKTAEFAQMLGNDFTVSDLRSVSHHLEVEETGVTFEENAILKAVAASRMTDVLVVADDSGLEVESLGGAPGVRSARYAGEHATDSQNVAKLLTELRRAGGFASGARARFCCALAIARNGVAMGAVAGDVCGTIVERPTGEGGFGYDPVFVPDGFQETFAELGAETKNRISHRARAVAQLPHYLSLHPAQKRLPTSLP